MGKIFQNGWNVLSAALIALLMIWNLWQDSYTKLEIDSLRNEHDALVLRLSGVLPGAAYITEPEDDKFDKERFTREISTEMISGE